MRVFRTWNKNSFSAPFLTDKFVCSIPYNCVSLLFSFLFLSLFNSKSEIEFINFDFDFICFDWSELDSIMWECELFDLRIQLNKKFFAFIRWSRISMVLMLFAREENLFCLVFYLSISNSCQNERFIAPTNTKRKQRENVFELFRFWHGATNHRRHCHFRIRNFEVNFNCIKTKHTNDTNCHCLCSHTSMRQHKFFIS